MVCDVRCRAHICRAVIIQTTSHVAGTIERRKQYHEQCVAESRRLVDNRQSTYGAQVRFTCSAGERARLPPEIDVQVDERVLRINPSPIRHDDRQSKAEMMTSTVVHFGRIMHWCETFAALPSTPTPACTVKYVSTSADAFDCTAPLLPTLQTAPVSPVRLATSTHLNLFRLPFYRRLRDALSRRPWCPAVYTARFCSPVGRRWSIRRYRAPHACASCRRYRRNWPPRC